MKPSLLDWHAAEARLQDVARLERSQALAIDAASDSDGTRAPEFRAAYGRAIRAARRLGVKPDRQLYARIEDLTMRACNTNVGMVDFLHNFRPEVTVFDAIEAAWHAALLRQVLDPADVSALERPWRASHTSEHGP